MTREEVEKLRKEIPVGRIIRCISMIDPHPIPTGTIGIVEHIDDDGQIHMNWENGSSLALVPNEDVFEIIAKDLEIGDEIICNNQKIMITKILTQEAYVFSGEEVYDIEFIDNNGNYRHWKSNLDGGTVCRKKQK